MIGHAGLVVCALLLLPFCLYACVDRTRPRVPAIEAPATITLFVRGESALGPMIQGAPFLVRPQHQTAWLSGRTDYFGRVRVHVPPDECPVEIRIHAGPNWTGHQGFYMPGQHRVILHARRQANE